MTGEPLTAKQAKEIGPINRSLPDEQPDQHVQTIVEKLLRLPPHAVDCTETSLNLALKQLRSAAFETSRTCESYTVKMDDVEEAIRSLVEKRQGRYPGSRDTRLSSVRTHE